MNKSRQLIAQSSVDVTARNEKMTLSLAFGTAGERSVLDLGRPAVVVRNQLGSMMLYTSFSD
jgi:hypothetical protein